MPKISVIVPVYNVENYLRRCVDSILSQTFTDFELILVDDGSPDGCPCICDEYAQKDSRVRVIHRENRGVSFARNAGLDIMTGEYVTFCDSDDYFAPDRLEVLLNAAKQQDADVVVSLYQLVYENGQDSEDAWHEIGEYFLSDSQERLEYSFAYIFGHRHGWKIWTRLFKADIIKAHSLRFCESCAGFMEDLGFVLEYALFAKRILSISYTGYYYSQRQDSVMRGCGKQWRLDPANEVSIHFMDVCKSANELSAIDKDFPIVHFLIMLNQYGKIIGDEQYARLKELLQNIQQYDHWRHYTKQLFGCRKRLKRYFGKVNARRMLLLSHYCLHGNWKRFQLESALLYKFNTIDE